MNALYKNRIYNVVDIARGIKLDGAGVEPFDVSFSDPDLEVEPTDYEVADNLAEWYGVDTDSVTQLRLRLLGRISLSEWQEWKVSQAHNIRPA